jgi:hypothetical protein
MTVRARLKAWWNASAWPRLVTFGRWLDVAANCFFKKWWRPVTCVIAAGTVYVNGIHIPLAKHEAADLTGLAALLAALSPFAIARTVELVMGRKDDPNA